MSVAGCRKWCSRTVGNRTVSGETPVEARARGSGCLSVCGLITCLFGLLVALPLHDALAEQIREGVLAFMVMDSTASGAWAGWSDSTDPTAGQVVSTYWFFNVTNPDEVMNGGRPVLQEVGPVRYLYTNKKYNVTWENDATEVVFREYQTYTPLDDATLALQDANLTTLNVVLLGALHIPSSFLDDVLPFLDPPIPPKGSLFTKRTIKDMLFGYMDTDTLGVPFKYPGIQPNDTSLGYALSQHSTHRMATGKGDSHRANEYLEWNAHTELKCCSGELAVPGPIPLSLPAGNIAGEANAPEPCAPLWDTYAASAIKGVFGTAFHPFIDPAETLHLATYPFGILRSWPLQCGNVGKGPGPGLYNDGSPLTANIGGCNDYVIKGVEMLRFDLPPWVMGNASVSADEAAGYNVTGPSGIVGIGPCETFAPIFLSRPHFLHGSDSLRDAFDGISPPVAEVHDSWLGVEPVTGKVMDFQFRVQINAAVGPTTIQAATQQWTYFPEVQTFAAFPIGWGQQQSSVTPSQGDQFRSQVYMPLIAAAGIRWGGVTLTVLGFFCAVAFGVRQNRLRAEALKLRAGGEGALERLLAGSERDSDDVGIEATGLN